MISIEVKYLPVFFLAGLLAGCGPSLPEGVELAMAQLPEEIDYNLHVKPILSDRCFACHGPDQNSVEAGLQLHTAGTAYAESAITPGQYAIVPGKLRQSQLYSRILSTDPEYMMPPPGSNLSLSDADRAVLIRWIDQGAVYKPHWAFIPPQMPTLPRLVRRDWTNNEIDHFVLAQLESRGWTPKEQADREILLRRVSFDLTGLPPSLAEMDDFVNDTSPDAYEKVVDRLLASPHYGERLAVDWLDIARFADTHGYTVDRFRDMSPWRDWVIKAFNENMPFDQFLSWQLAGDLLPPDPDPVLRKEQILATAFNRNHQQNMEGGIVDEEFRVEYVADRTNTLGAAFLGLTLECARCHDHKYDPISQKEYYQLFSFFNNVKEAGQISYDNATPVPAMLLTDAELDQTLAFIDQQIEQKEKALSEMQASAQEEFEDWLSERGSSAKLDQRLSYGKLAHFDLEDDRLANQLNPRQTGRMKQQFVQEIRPQLTEGRSGKGLLLDGDAWLDLSPVGQFDRTSAFTVAIWVKLPRTLNNGVIFHKGEGAALYNFRGFHVALQENKTQILMAHATPYNALIQYGPDLPREKWTHLVLRYDGSCRANGLELFVDGKILSTEVDQDQLYKPIGFGRKGDKEPGLQIGARWRGMGIKGAVVDDIEVFDRWMSALEILALYDRTKAADLLKKDRAALTIAEKDDLREYWWKESSDSQELKAWRQRKKETLDTIPEIMVIREMPEPRPTFILERGQYHTPAQRVDPGTPASLPDWPGEQPKNRLGLSRWLLHKDHPLTSRVLVNRYWQQFFGQGLVRTTEDFGSQGESPSHPLLLDWLALRFRQSGWNIKSLLKEIVMSATYRQSSIATGQDRQMDPTNVWLGRGPSARLSAEMMRDNVLAASGLLVKDIGGPSVKPYQPEGLWRVNGTRYEPDTATGLYRRSLYSFWKRTVPLPTQSIFDAPSRSGCTVKRQTTSTPLQALVLLNDPSFTENAKIIGAEISAAEELRHGVERAFRRLTGRRPQHPELELLLELQQREYEKFKSYPDKAAGWLNAGASRVGTDEKVADPNWIAANTVVASAIMNTDAAVVKR